MKNEEYKVQCSVIKYIDAKYPHILYNASTGGARYGSGKTAMIRGAMQKRAGAKKGFPDIAIYETSKFEQFEPEGKRCVYGLFIELKAENGKTSAEQEIWIERLNSRGYKAVVCYGYDDAILVIDVYLGG